MEGGGLSGCGQILKHLFKEWIGCLRRAFPNCFRFHFILAMHSRYLAIVIVSVPPDALGKGFYLSPSVCPPCQAEAAPLCALATAGINLPCLSTLHLAIHPIYW